MENNSTGIENPEDFPNLLAGTFTDGRQFSTGNTLPLVGMPWGFNHWAPMTTDLGRADSWWFNGNTHYLTWLRCTHQPSPWIGDWGYFVFGPQMGPRERNPRGYWEPRSAHLKPHMMDIKLAPDGMRIELVPTMHAAAMKVTYPPVNLDKRVCFREARWTNHECSSSGDCYLIGRAEQINKDGARVSNFGIHIRVEVHSPGTQIDSTNELFCFKFTQNTVEVRMATSLISDDQARANLQQEAPVSSTFTQLGDSARNTWRHLLGRVDIKDSLYGQALTGNTNRQLQVFYTGLYRALTFPRRIDEIDSSGQMVHYR